jgi:hypothetical protein
MATTGYPLGKKGSIIGTPHTGTHTLGNWQSDNAYDLGVPVGTPVYAVADGTIGSNLGSQGAAAGSRFAGLRVQLNGAGNSWWYGHLSKLAVRAGQKVQAGQLLGYSGSANGVAHLHIAQERGDLKSSVLDASGSVVQAGSPIDIANDALRAVHNNPAEAGTVGDIPGTIIKAAADALGVDGARILLWIVFVGGGAALAMLGLSRATGLKPTSLNPVALAGKAVAGG